MTGKSELCCVIRPGMEHSPETEPPTRIPPRRAPGWGAQKNLGRTPATARMFTHKRAACRKEEYLGWFLKHGRGHSQLE